MARFVEVEEDGTTITSPKGKYVVEDIVASGDIADIYRSGDKALKIVRNPDHNELMANEVSVLRQLWKEGEPEEDQRLYLPNLTDTFRLEEKKPRNANAFVWLTNFYTLEQVRVDYQVAPVTLRFEHGVWMLNRILEGLDYIHEKGFVHGSVLPPHLMVYASENNKDRYTHGVKLIDFTAAVPTGAKLPFVSSSWKKFYPPEIYKDTKVTPALDIFMAVKSIIYVLGGGADHNELPESVPDYLSRFLRACVEAKPQQRPRNAWRLHEELAGLMLRNFGPKKYIHFEMPKTA